MRIILVIFLLFLQSFDIIFCDDGFVTIWAPKSLFNGGSYNVFYLPSGLNEQIKAKLSVQFRRKNATIDLKNGEGLRIGFKNKASLNSRKKFDLFVTLYREIKKNGDTIQQCVTRKLSVNSEKRKFYTFIQMDKPIYKPGDEVKFRILVLDRELKPYHMNNIHINITDPFDRSIKVISDLGESFLGVFNSKFSLSSNTPLGNWKIKVLVDKVHEFENFKIFSVQKYTLPPFDVHISTEHKAMLKTEDLKISFHAKFSFGEFVNGNAKLMIIDPKTGKQFLSESFRDVQGVKKVTYSIKNKLKITTSTKIDLEATLSFSEPESSYSVNKTIQFSVYGDSSRKIRPIHGDSFIPGLPFNTKVVAYEWNGEIIQEHSDVVEIVYTYKLKNSQNEIVRGKVKIVDGLATFNSIAPKRAVGLKIEVQFSNSKPYSKNIEQGVKNAGREEISVDYFPKKPKVNSKIQIFAKSTVELDTIVIIIMTRYGNSQSMQIDCKSQLNCVFDVTVTKEMIPQSKIIVYCVKSREAIYYGSKILVSDEFGENYLDVSIPATSRTKEKVTMMFNTTDKSEVFLLAYDKRLTYLQKGNDVRNEDVVESVGNFDNGSSVFIANLKNWKTCSADDVKRVKSGVVNRKHSDDTIYADDIDDEEDELLGSDDEETTDQAHEDAINDEELRDNFPEAWIFDNFTVGENEYIEMTYTVPDSITSWMISTFSINKNHGLAVASTKELIVKNEFFIDMILPYSIRFQEIFRLDILVFNYIDTKQQLEANIELSSSGGKEFEIVEYQGDQPVFKNNKKQTKSVTVPHSTLKKVSFYIRRLPSNKKTEGNEKFMKIFVYGSARDKIGNIYKDNVKITTYRSRQKLPRSLMLDLSINKYYNPHCLVLD